MLALLLLSLDAGKMFHAAATGVVLAAIAEAVILTFTRTGLITMASSLAIVSAWRHDAQRTRRRREERCLPWSRSSPIKLLASHSLESVRLRMTTETPDAWYRASIDAPLDISLTTGSTNTVPVTVINTGLRRWDSSSWYQYGFNYLWLLADSGCAATSLRGLRTTFVEPVPPGSTVTRAQRALRCPAQPGQYTRLMWDLCRRKAGCGSDSWKPAPKSSSRAPR